MDKDIKYALEALQSAYDRTDIQGGYKPRVCVVGDNHVVLMTRHMDKEDDIHVFDLMDVINLWRYTTVADEDYEGMFQEFWGKLEQSKDVEILE